MCDPPLLAHAPKGATKPPLCPLLLSFCGVLDGIHQLLRQICDALRSGREACEDPVAGGRFVVVPVDATKAPVLPVGEGQDDAGNVTSLVSLSRTPSHTVLAAF